MEFFVYIKMDKSQKKYCLLIVHIIANYELVFYKGLSLTNLRLLFNQNNLKKGFIYGRRTKIHKKTGRQSRSF